MTAQQKSQVVCKIISLKGHDRRRKRHMSEAQSLNEKWHQKQNSKERYEQF